MFSLFDGHKGIVQHAGTDHCAHWYRAVGQTFGDIQNIWRHAEGLCGESSAHARKACDYLVKDQQYIVLVANLSQPLQIVLRWHDDTGRSETVRQSRRRLLMRRARG